MDSELGYRRLSTGLFDLPRELRDEIWSLSIAGGIELPSEQADLRIYDCLMPTRQRLTIFSLPQVNKKVKQETTHVIRNRLLLSLSSSVTANQLLVQGASFWGQDGQFRAKLRDIRHVSIIPRRTIHSKRYRFLSHSFLATLGQQRIIHCSSEHPHGWRNFDAYMARFLRSVGGGQVKLRSLEIPAALLLNVSVVRWLRKLRDIDVHFAFVPEGNSDVVDDDDMLQGLLVQNTAQRSKWVRLAETGDTDIVLPIYKTPLDTTPVALAPLSCFAAAIRREVRSTSPPLPRPVGVSAAEVSPPLWIDFDQGKIITTEHLLPPSPGWYRYSARDPGVVCLEMCGPPPLPQEPRRHEMRQKRKEMGRQDLAQGSFYPGRAMERLSQVDLPRARVIQRMGIQGAIIKHEKVKRRTLG